MATPDPILTSASNPLIQFARQVRDGKQKDFLLIEGDRLLSDAIQAGLQWHQSFHSTQPSPRQQQLLSALHQLQCPTRPVSEKLLQSLSATVHSQNLIAIAHKPNLQPTAFWSRIHQQKSPALLVVLDQVQDPGNVGSIIRTAEAAGASGVLAAGGTAHPFSWKAARGSMGSVLRLPIHRATDAVAAVRACREATGIKGWKENSADGLFTMTEVECLGACVNAPILQVDDDYYEDMDHDSTVRLLEALKRGERPPHGSAIGRQAAAPEGGPMVLTGSED
jgi:tRNA G18 (ribose-2'-O)-methylase SpoU/(2Fe-2S) ferredoxin